MEDLCGIVVVDKDKGYTSTRVVELIRKFLGVKKAGHLGTLDPMATGVLPVAIGKATKLADFFMSMEKEYIGVIKLGVLTDSYDVDGKVIREESPPILDEEIIKKVLNEFIGEIWQVPPMYSAKRYKGKRLYELARKGIEVEREPKKVFVRELVLLKYEHPFITFRVVSGKGVYIRVLAKDIAEKLGTIGVLWSLDRVKACGFDKSMSFKIDYIGGLDKEERLKIVIPLEKALDMLPTVRVFGKLRWWVVTGNPFLVSPDELGKGVTSEYVKIVDEENKIVGLGKVVREERRLKVHPVRILV